MPFAIEPSTEVRSRYDFGLFCNCRGVIEAAEIGVDRGEFAFHFMQRWRGNTMLLIDPYEPYENMPWGRESDRLMAIMRLYPFGDRVKFIPLRSPESAGQIHGDWHLQFVYIDGCHTDEAVKADVEAWYDRIDPGGVLAGHDWCEGNAVKRIVTEFAKAKDLTVYIVRDSGTPDSWYVIKPK